VKRRTQKIAMGAALLATTIGVAPPHADASKRPTNRARIHALEKKVARLSRDLAILEDRMQVIAVNASVALHAVQCTYSLPYQWSAETETFRLLGTDQVDESSMWIVFAATGPDCSGTVVPS
jgi:hypothetical protein